MYKGGIEGETQKNKTSYFDILLCHQLPQKINLLVSGPTIQAPICMYVCMHTERGVKHEERVENSKD